MREVDIYCGLGRTTARLFPTDEQSGKYLEIDTTSPRPCPGCTRWTETTIARCRMDAIILKEFDALGPRTNRHRLEQTISCFSEFHPPYIGVLQCTPLIRKNIE